jgi:hypothetical protein
MNSSGAKRAALTVLALGLCAGGYLLLRQQQALQDLEGANSRLATGIQGLESEIKESRDRLKAAETERARVSEPNREVPMLRSNVAALRRELAAANAERSARAQAAIPVAGPAEAGSQTNLITYTGTAHATMMPGQTLVMGGWTLQPGKRTLAFFTPERGAAADAGSVLVRGLYLEVPESALTSPGWGQFQAADKVAAFSGLLENGVVEALKKLEGAEILSQPRFLTTSGNPGTINVSQANGAGFETTIEPVWSADGQTIDLTISNALRRVGSPGSQSR